MHCVNRNIPEFKLLTDQSGLSEEALAAKVSVWQDRHNTDAIPSMVELYNSPNQGIKYQLPKQQSDSIDNVFDENLELAEAIYEGLGFNKKLAFVKSDNTIDDDFYIKDELIITKELQNIRTNNFDGSINIELSELKDKLNKLSIGNKFNVSEYTKPSITNLEEVLNKINLSESNKILLEKIRPLIKNIKIEYVDKFILANSGAVYSDKYNTIRINKSEKNIPLEELLMHELLHAATFRKITYFETNTKGLSEKESLALNELENIRKVLKEASDKYWNNRTRYARSVNPLEGYRTDSIHEIISYAFTNEEFRNAIAEIPYTGNKSILDKLVELIANIFGVKQNTVLNALLANAEVLLNNNQITPQQKQQAKEVYQQYLDSELGSKQDIQQVKEFISSRNNQGNNQSLQEGLNWLESVNPNVQPEIVQGLIDGIANGSYNSNLDLITLSEEFANKKTVKHEFLHSVASRLFATQEHYVLDKMIKKGEIEENCTGKLKAKEGLQFNFKHGGEWKIIKDLKGYPTHEKGGVDLTIGKNGVSIKNGDTQFTAKHGLVISAIKAQEGLVETLPVASQYAGDGSLLPDWDKVKTTLNPYNWGVTDYSDKGDFNTAYSTARKSGEKEFLFNGKRYNTNYKGTPQQQLKETGLTNEQIQDRSKLNKNLTENIYPYSYNNLEKRIWKAGVLGKKEENREAIDKDPRPYDKEKLDALNLYAGVPQKNNTFRISNYKPSISKDNINYYTFNKQDDKFVQNLIDYAYLKSKGSTDGSAKGYDVGVKGLVPDQEKNVMGNYKMSTGKDDRGAYVSFYDEWDLAPMDFGKPFEIYDRIYTKDYGDGKQKRMYYTDKELSELNIDKKDFDTLGLQRELSNRGYKLPKSTKQDGSFDGIWGDETKNALLEYRKSQNKSKQ